MEAQIILLSVPITSVLSSSLHLDDENRLFIALPLYDVVRSNLVVIEVQFELLLDTDVVYVEVLGQHFFEDL